jgi:hypothetical protein
MAVKEEKRPAFAGRFLLDKHLLYSLPGCVIMAA